MDAKKAPTDSSLQSVEAVLMEDHASDANGAEIVDESFMCCICLDLLYKPVVLGCGHIACFWCINRAMNGVGKSYCPVCRCPYHHFPSICQLLHFLLLKIYPMTYKIREKQVLEEEEKAGCSSPQIDELSTGFHPWNFKDDGNLVVEGVEHNFPDGDLKDRAYMPVSINDVLCIGCGELLFQPVVFNCGHVYCESCITTKVDEKLRCQLCHSPHPKGFMKVCLELDHFLEKHFSKEYALRTEAHLQRIHCQQSITSSCATQNGKCFTNPSSPTRSYLSWFSDLGPNIHFGAGCDYCGMYPIIGERYRCKDCVEKIGFDLCGECYNSQSKRPGRFNQQHRPEHKFELVRAQFLRNIMLRLASESSEDGSAVPVLSDDASEDPEDGHAAHSLSDDTPENPESTNSTI